MEIQAIIALVTVVAAALQIILFFKLWGMTNDVSKMQKKYVGLPNIYIEIYKLCLLGKKQEAKELIFNKFYEEIQSEKGLYIAKDNLRYRLKEIDEPMPEIIALSDSWDDLKKFIKRGYDIYSKDIPVN